MKRLLVGLLAGAPPARSGAERSASMNLCRDSDEPFNTNEVIWPHCGIVPFHPPTLAAFAAIFGLIACPAIWLARRDEKAGGLRNS